VAAEKPLNAKVGGNHEDGGFVTEQDAVRRVGGVEGRRGLDFAGAAEAGEDVAGCGRPQKGDVEIRAVLGVMLEPADGGDGAGETLEGLGVVVTETGVGAEGGRNGSGEIAENCECGGLIAGEGHVVAGEETEIRTHACDHGAEAAKPGAIAADVEVGEMEDAFAQKTGRKAGERKINQLSGGLKRPRRRERECWGEGGLHGWEVDGDERLPCRPALRIVTLKQRNTARVFRGD